MLTFPLEPSPGFFYENKDKCVRYRLKATLLDTITMPPFKDLSVFAINDLDAATRGARLTEVPKPILVKYFPPLLFVFLLLALPHLNLIPDERRNGIRETAYIPSLLT